MSSAANLPDEPTGDLTPGEPGPTRDFESAQGADAANAAMRSSATGASLGAGDAVGPYTLVKMIGEGGFGEVWLAERREPMVQRVALKVIKAGMDSKAVVARFEQERQALAVMDHPHVARVFDGGVTASGRPYFVMEYVEGETITAFADRKRLTLRARLELFIPVCEAVQHAHHKGLVHRDLKPSNVLVAEIEGRPVPKVIDFGVAKAIAGEGWANTAHTQSGVVIGTPLYMSPEQVAGEVDVDTRADVYSLGVMLYELLTGEVPFDAGMLRKAALAEVQRIIRDVTPPKPSTRVAELADARTTTVAEARSSSRERISGELRRELDWIPLMALRKERERRYESPQALADDVRRYLDGRPLRAAPDSKAYLARKFVRRNRVQVLAAAVVFLALTAGLVVALWQRNEAIRAKDAEAEQRAEAEAQRTRADERADAAEKAEAAASAARDAEKERADQLKKVSDFQSQMLAQIDTTKAGIDLMKDVRERFVAALEKAGVPEADRTARVDALQQELVRVNATDAAAAMIDRTILKPAIKTIDEQFKDDPATDASLRQALADLYCMIGRYDAAFPLQESALATRRRVLGEEHPDTLTTIHNMGSVLKKLGRLDEAEPYHREALEKSRRALGEEHPDTLASLSSMGSLLSVQGKLAEAEPLYREALDRRRRVLGEEHPDTLVSISNMGFLLGSLGELDEAERFHREGLEKSRRVLGEEHRDTLGAIRNMGGVLRAQGRLAEAEPYHREALTKSRRVLGEDHPETLTSINNMGGLLRAQGKLAEAEPFTREALEKRRRLLGEEHPETLTSINNTGALLLTLGKLAEAEPLFREALEGRRRVLGEEHPETIISIGNMGFLLRAQGNLAEAEPYLREAVEKSRRTLGEEHPNTLVGIGSLARLLQQQRKYQDVVDLLAPIEASARKTLIGSNPTQLAGFLAALGRARAGIGSDAERLALAEANLIEGHAILLAANGFGPTHKDTLDCVQALVDLYTAWHTAESGKGYDAKAVEWRARLPTKPTVSEP
jgi:serine/threonine protein kinase